MPNTYIPNPPIKFLKQLDKKKKWLHQIYAAKNVRNTVEIDNKAKQCTKLNKIDAKTATTPN